jgi:hypothetical protein
MQSLLSSQGLKSGSRLKQKTGNRSMKKRGRFPDQEEKKLAKIGE